MANAKNAQRPNNIVAGRAYRQQQPNSVDEYLLQQGDIASVSKPTNQTFSPRKKVTHGKDTSEKILRKTKAAGIATAQSYAYLPLYALQVGLAVIYVVSVYLAEDTIAGYIIPLESLQWICWAALIILGCIAMTQAYLAFVAARVGVTQGSVTLSFLFFTACFFVPYLAFLPLLIFWVWLVVVLAK